MPRWFSNLPVWLRAFPRRHMVALSGTLLFTVVILLLLPATQQLEQEVTRVKPIDLQPPINPEPSIIPSVLTDTKVAEQKAPPSNTPEPSADLRPQPAKKVDAPIPFHFVTVKSGDTLSDIFSEQGLGAKWVLAILKSKEGEKLKRLVPGDRLGFVLSGKDELQQLRFQESLTRYIDYIANEPYSFTSTVVKLETESIPRYAEGTILNSLFYDGNKAGLSEKTIMEFAGLFGWDIDFALDLREGDRFRIIYEEIYFKGEKVRDGDILVAEFVNQGKAFRALKYTDSQGEVGYYTPEGRSVKKAFIRTPVDFARISSRFNLRRKHPVLHTIRAHRGVDYAASPGTPIKATGNGKVKFIGRKGGYGNVIILQHGSRYTTLYAHMKGFRRGLKRGSRIKQGQVIGYVGSTGLASGPHLHYEFRVDGVHRDPLRVKLPQALPIVKKERKNFDLQAQAMLAQLAAEEKEFQIATNDG